MKYPSGAMHVSAEYAKRTENIFVDAMPKELPIQEFRAVVGAAPAVPAQLDNLSNSERRQALSCLNSFFAPMGYTHFIYSWLHRAILSSYVMRPSPGSEGGYGWGQGQSSAILGISGIGKTTAIRRCLATMPQVIEHASPYDCKQILYLNVEAPSDCSAKTLVLSMVAAIDDAVGSNHLKELAPFRSFATSMLVIQLERLLKKYNVGLMVVDNIQNVISTAQRKRQIHLLSGFLAGLSNDTYTSILFVGRLEAGQFFDSNEHLKRRTRGPRLLPFRPGNAYRHFLETLWPYQMTRQKATLTEEIANMIYNHSAGIPSHIVKIFQESQSQALMLGLPSIDTRVIQSTSELLNIPRPSLPSECGHSISDDEVEAPGEAMLYQLAMEHEKSSEGKPTHTTAELMAESGITQEELDAVGEADCCRGHAQ